MSHRANALTAKRNAAPSRDGFATRDECLPPALPARMLDVLFGLRLEPLREVGMLAAPINTISPRVIPGDRVASISTYRFRESWWESLAYAFAVFALFIWLVYDSPKHTRFASRLVH